MNAAQVLNCKAPLVLEDNNPFSTVKSKIIPLKCYWQQAHSIITQGKQLMAIKILPSGCVQVCDSS